MADAVDKAATPRLACALGLLGLVATSIGNVIPLYGVLYWQWDTFQLLMLDWMERPSSWRSGRRCVELCFLFGCKPRHVPDR